MINLSIKIKLIIIIFIAILLTTILLTIQSVETIKDLSNQNIIQYKKQVIEAKKESLKNYVDIAKGILQIYRDKVTPTTTKKELEIIKKDAIDAINHIRYGDNGYIFIISYDGYSIALALRPDLVGTNVMNIRGGGGKWTTKDFIRLAKQDGGHYYTYKWKTTKDSPYQNKIAYSYGIQDWVWVVGTGEYMAKEEQLVKDKELLLKQNTDKLITNIIIKALILSFIIGIIFIILVHKMINKPLNTLSIGLNNFFMFLQNKKKTIEPIEVNSNDEFGQMIKIINDNINVSSKLHSKIKDLNQTLEIKVQEKTQEIERQKETFEVIYNGSKDAIAILDMESNFLQVNPAYIEMTGFTQNELLSDSCLNLTVSKDIQPSKDAMKEVVKVGFIKNFEKDCIIKNGKYITINMSMSILHNPERILISVRDVTELKDQEEELKSILDTVMETVIILEDKKVVSVNQKTLDVFGYKTQQEIIGNTPLSFISDDTKHIVLENLKLNNANPYQAKGLKKDGTTFPALIQGKNIILRNKTIRVSTLLDISELKNTEKALEIERTKAQQANKSKSQFLANMSHEIRTPMNGIIGMLHLASQTNLNDKQKNYLQKIDNSAKSLLEIINDILDFSKIEAGKLDINKIDFNFKELLQNVSNIVKSKANEKGLDFEINYDKNIDYLYGDSLRISQILINLINNAIKFTQKGYVKIDISKKENDNFIFEIEDTGIGISKEQQSKLFQSFSQADASTTRKYGGTGLGLSISKQLVELMGGKIWVESELDIGSKFIFEIKLPKGDENNIKIKKQIDISKIATLKGSHILLVEDNAINQEIILGLLEHSGIRVCVASNGKEAIDMYEKNYYELVLMDLQMPIMDGFEATKFIRNIDTDIPIIAISANVMQEDREKTKKAGMNEHLNKPIDVEKLYATLLKYISKKVEIKDVVELDKDNITIPSFMNIDTKKGLSYMAGNKNLYFKILQDFYTNYNTIKLNDLEDSELQRVVHTIKGLSGNIGAEALSVISCELEDTLDKNLFDMFYIELNKVLSELALLNLQIEDKTITLLEITQIKRDTLFNNLYEFAVKRRAKGCRNIVQELEAYRLKEQDKKIVEDIKSFIDTRNYQSIIELLQKDV